MTDHEVIHTPMDKRGAGTGFPGEGYRRRTGNAPGRAVLWHDVEVFDFPAPDPVWGAFPIGFTEFAIAALQCRAADILHVCSGALGADVGGVRVDLRAAARPTVRADGRNLPFRDGQFAGVLIDPPYSVEYAADLYGVDYPRPSHLLREAARVVRAGGVVGFVHFLVPSPGPDLQLVKVRAVTQGCGYRIRAFTLMAKRQAGLFDEVVTS